jgi:Chemoreceptor zinc-binding domain
MFKKIASAFGLSSAPDKEVTEVINIYDAVLAHQAWKKRLMDYMDGRSKEDLQPSKICKDNLCVLGKWIHSNGKVQFGKEQVFVKLVDEHAKFHVDAAKVVEAHQEGKEGLAREILAGSFEEQSRKTITCLAKLNTIVEAHNQKLENK